jgi:hypothetical protein
MKTTENSLTIIIPCYNGCKKHDGRHNHKIFLDTVLASITTQDTFNEQNIFITIVDDKSTDNSTKIINKWIKRYPHKITLVKNQKNMGAGFTKWNGILHCKTEFFYIMDVDDWMTPNSLNILSTFLKYDYDCVVFPKRYTLYEHKRSRQGWNHRNVYGFMSTNLYKTSLFENVKFDKYMTTTFLDDAIFGPLLRLHIKKMHVCNKRIYYYSYYLTSSSNCNVQINYGKKMMHDFKNLFKILTDNKNLSKKTLKYFYISYSTILGHLKNKFSIENVKTLMHDINQKYYIDNYGPINFENFCNNYFNKIKFSR